MAEGLRGLRRNNVLLSSVLYTGTEEHVICNLGEQDAC